MTKHTRRLRRTECIDCHVTLSDENAYRAVHHSGWRTRCKDCYKKKRRANHDANEAALRAGLTRDVCDICKKPETVTRAGRVRILNKDHDHSTGQWRGLLCSRCNTGLGVFRDNPAILRAAAEYLENPPGLDLADGAA